MRSAPIPEHALRQIWKHQRFRTDSLRTCDGRPVTVLFPGSPNPDSGPDFLDARLRIGGVHYTGDVEVHCDAGAWFQHGHGRNPLYNRVVLHVVLTDRRPSPPAQTASRRILPLLILQPLPASSSGDFLPEGDMDRPSRVPCSAADHRISRKALFRLLGSLADQRLEQKVRRYRQRLLQLADERLGILRERTSLAADEADEIPLPAAPPGSLRDRHLWEQLLYEAIMECLGYEKNREPFLALARAVPLEDLRRHGLQNTRTMMAILFGQGGLLPSMRTVNERESRRYLLDLKRHWRLLFPRQRHPFIHSPRWLFFRLRPRNFPTARLAAFSFLLPSLFGPHSFQSLISAFRDDRRSSPVILGRIHLLFRFTPDAFWSSHVQFGIASRRGGAVLGKGRIGDIIINGLLPIVALYAGVFNDNALGSAAHGLYREHPRLQQNRITRCVERRLLNRTGVLDTARIQQGALQLHAAFCTAGRCDECVVILAAQKGRGGITERKSRQNIDHDRTMA